MVYRRLQISPERAPYRLRSEISPGAELLSSLFCLSWHSLLSLPFCLLALSRLKGCFSRTDVFRRTQGLSLCHTVHLPVCARKTVAGKTQNDVNRYELYVFIQLTKKAFGGEDEMS